MDPKFLNPRFFQHFDPVHWENEVCADLAPALRLLLAEPDNAIASMGLENVRMHYLTVLLKQPPSAGTLARVVSLCTEQPKLRPRPQGIVCSEHYHGIEWDLPVPPQPPPPPQKKPSLLKRLFG